MCQSLAGLDVMNKKKNEKKHTNIALKSLPVCRVHCVLTDVGDGAVAQIAVRQGK